MIFVQNQKKSLGKFKKIEHDLRRAKVAVNSNRERHKIELQRDSTLIFFWPNLQKEPVRI